MYFQMNNNFDFIRETNNEGRYKELVPSWLEGRTIILLYERYENDTFREEDIIEIIQTIRETPSKRITDNNEVISNLQKYFIFKDERADIYKLQEYAKAFCELIKNKLITEFKPSEIKEMILRIIDGFNIEKYNEDPDLFIFDVIYYLSSSNKLSIKQQIYTLRNQIDIEMDNFREILRKREDNLLQSLENIQDSFLKIGDNVTILQEIFENTNILQENIRNLYVHPFSDNWIEGIKIVLDFIKEIKEETEIVRKRIDRIIPYIKTFIHYWNQREFDRNTKQFIQYLIDKSSVIKKEGKEMLKLPDSLSYQRILIREILPVFSVIEKDRLIVKKRKIPSLNVILSKEDENELKNKSKINKADTDKILSRIKEIEMILNDKKILAYKHYFFQMIKEDNLSIAIKVTNHTLRIYTNHVNYTIEIDQTTIIYQDTNAIWDMTIYKH